MSALDQYVEVYITRQTTSIATASFNIPLILTSETSTDVTFTSRTRTYTSLDGVAEDWAISGDTYKIAQKIYEQDLVPTTLVIGRKLADPETYPEALVAVIEENNQWYALVTDTHVAADIEAIAAEIEAREKLYFVSSSDAGIVDTNSTTDVGYVLSNAKYDRTILIYHTKADTEFPEAAWLWQLQEVPGSNNWAFKVLSGVSADSLSSSKITVLTAKHVNYYITVAGANIIMTGCVASGEWIDTMVFVDWLKARLQEQVFFRMINTKKIPLKLAA